MDPLCSTGFFSFFFYQFCLTSFFKVFFVPTLLNFSDSKKRISRFLDFFRISCSEFFFICLDFCFFSSDFVLHLGNKKSYQVSKQPYFLVLFTLLKNNFLYTGFLDFLFGFLLFAQYQSLINKLTKLRRHALFHIYR